ncbi:BQ5605_C001g00880 [Microbotryum silenes-dioicae]|uniref:BQ5605_C001g00880 protein n=1 Tax=Microbotryum silenes-dioicae TaxID=796604 RepID=A0A2X0M4J1_9BASI|nr:BQ5605_C001g00880 [Microbotryum silenes-dioicae]
MAHSAQDQVLALSAPLTLPGGLELPNRLTKAAMEEMLGRQGIPTPADYKLYEEWARGGWGLLLTGNVQVSSRHLGTPLDIVVPDRHQPQAYEKALDAFTKWAETCHGDEPKPVPTIMQLCHTGRQSMRGSGRGVLEPSLAPSAILLKPADSVLGWVAGSVMFGQPKAMDEKELDEVVDQFLQGALLAKKSGFDGVQLHCSHGYLLAQFMSPKTNVRTDAYGGSNLKRTKLLFRIIDAIRSEIPFSTGFALGIKLNSSDYVKGGLTEEDALDHVRWIAEHGGVDFIEISGGTYENPAMLGDKAPDELVGKGQAKPKKSTSNREAFFLSFAQKARELLLSLPQESLPTPAPVVLLTGGLRTREGMAEALLSNSTDLVGLGRPACADPSLPLKLLDASLSPQQARAPSYGIKHTGFGWIPFQLIGPGMSTLFHTMLLQQIVDGDTPDYRMSFGTGLWRVWLAPVLRKARLKVTLVIATLVALVYAFALKRVH